MELPASMKRIRSKHLRKRDDAVFPIITLWKLSLKDRRSGHGRTTFLAENGFGQTTFLADYDFVFAGSFFSADHDDQRLSNNINN